MVILPLPPPSELDTLLEALLGRKVKSAAAAAAPGGKIAAALYATDPIDLGVVILCDLPLAAALGAALSGVPPAMAQEAARQGALDASLSENVGEVMNVLTRHLAARSARRFVLKGCWCPPAEPPAATVAQARGSDEIRAYRVEVAGYGAGELALCTL